MKAVAVAKSKIKNHPKVAVVGLLVVALILGGAIYIGYRALTTNATEAIAKANDAFIEGDKELSLEYAKKSLAKDPGNIDTMLLVAKLTNEKNPEEAKQYYALALKTYSEQNNPDLPGRTATVYWAAADLARRAGQTTEAKTYYAKVAPAANPQDGYEQSIATQSKEWLIKLQ